jgi:hypothetical protein
MIGKSQRVVTVLKRIRSRLIATGLWAFALAASIATPAQAQLVNASICHYSYYQVSWFYASFTTPFYLLSQNVFVPANGGAAVLGQYKLHYPNAQIDNQEVFSLFTDTAGAMYFAIWYWDGTQWVHAVSNWLTGTAAAYAGYGFDRFLCGPGY